MSKQIEIQPVVVNQAFPNRVTIAIPDDLQARIVDYKNKTFAGIQVTAAQIVSHLTRLGLESVEEKKKGKR